MFQPVSLPSPSKSTPISSTVTSPSSVWVWTTPAGPLRSYLTVPARAGTPLPASARPQAMAAAAFLALKLFLNKVLPPNVGRKRLPPPAGIKPVLILAGGGAEK